jgi:hypothetical protein
MMHGVNIPCEVIDGKLIPTTTTEAYLSITYNYSKYYHDAFPGIEENPDQYEMDKKIFHLVETCGGIRSHNGISGLNAVPILEEMICRIERKYRTSDGWIDAEQKDVWFENKKNRSIRKDQTDLFIEFLNLKNDGMNDEEAEKYLNEQWKRCEKIIIVNEGETKNYWSPTAANAIRPLYKLIALSRMRPDGIWSEES